MASGAAAASQVAPTGGVLRVLAVEPFYGGSHRAFLDGWSDTSRHRFDCVTFPDRHWKWRMRHAALSAAERVRELITEGRGWDVVWASDMLDLASFRGLCPEVGSLPTVLYFHENQLTHPWRKGPHSADEEGTGGDAHYAYTNFLSAVAADRIWFNSAFHRDQWLLALPAFLARFPDHRHTAVVERLAECSEVQSPGVAPIALDEETAPRAFHVVWAGRWEHDKNPEGFFDALRAWRERRPDQWRDADLRLKLHVLGQSYGQVPSCFETARSEFEASIATWGFVDRERYRRCLGRAQVFVSTAWHEFFGIAAVEAMTAGAHPLLPERLSYPELVAGAEDALYRGGGNCGGNESEELAARLAGLFEQARSGALPERERWSGLVDRYGWSRRGTELDRAVERLCTGFGEVEGGS